jgi:hypothetical protein
MLAVAVPIMPLPPAGAMGSPAVIAAARRRAALPVAVAAVAAMLPPGAAPAPIVQILVPQRVAVAIIVEHPHAVAGVIIIVVPTAAEADLDEAAAIVGRIIAVIAIAVRIGIGIIVVIVVRADPRRGIARAIEIAVIVAAAECRGGESAEGKGEGLFEAVGHDAILPWRRDGGAISESKLHEAS